MINRFNCTLFTAVVLSFLMPLNLLRGQEAPDSLLVCCTVTDAQEGVPIYLAALQVYGVGEERLLVVQTDDRGVCQFSMPKRSKCRVQIAYLGYDTLRNAFDFNDLEIEQDSFQVSFHLQPSSTQLNGVTIKSSRPVFRQEPGKLVMTIANTTLAEGSNMLEVLQKAPGISSNMDGSLTFRGKQGILVLIDNKNTYVTGEELSRYLETMPGSEVDKIEIISNPSARFDASGNVGIINIITKKSKEKHLNGSAQAGLTYGSHLRKNGNLSLNGAPSSKLSLYGSANISDAKTQTNSSSDRKVENIPNTLTFDQNENRVSDKLDSRLKFGMDYSSRKHLIGLLLHGFYTEQDIEGASTTNIRTTQIDSIVDFTNQSGSKWSNVSGNLNYQLKIDSSGKLLDFNLDFAGFDYQSKDNMRSRFFFPDGTNVRPDEVLRNSSPSRVNIGALKFDYTHPLKPGSYFQTGAKFSRAKTDNDLIFETQTQAGDWELFTGRSNRFRFDEDISAAYFDYYNRFGKTWDYGIGLRGEYSLSKGDNVTINSAFAREIFELFPSGYIRKTFGKQSLMLSGNKRIDRPDYNSLNPFVFYIDNYSFWRGNTNLRPQLAYTFDLTHSYNQRWFSSLFYTYTTDVAMQLPIQDDDSKIIFNTIQNIGVSHYGGASISYYAPIKSWWYLTSTLSGSMTKIIDKRNLEEEDRGVQGGQFNFYAYNGFTLPAKMRLEVTFNLNSANRSFWYVRGYTALHLGVSKNFPNSTLTLYAADIFDQTRYKASIDYQNLNIRSLYKPETRYIRLTYVYRFGNNELQFRNRQTGVEDELKRVKNN